MINLQWPERLNPDHFMMLFRQGRIDLGAILCWLALILIAYLLFKRMRLRTVKSGIKLVVVLIALSLIVAFSNWPDRVPPIYFDMHTMQIDAGISPQWTAGD